ncbi:hypothetical protein LOK49_LG15G02643 [Camellia lanceoleosa]|uniref:Uncharacterized protein n=1 Tax=Camellia lanceoleosa TaxID=1840588 RepID=A0ACC0F3Q8_9ERIC|nr:hypothetical protein LOK49_LG15G02643 [Camellia lanceoleosa]
MYPSTTEIHLMIRFTKSSDSKRLLGWLRFSYESISLWASLNIMVVQGALLPGIFLPLSQLAEGKERSSSKEDEGFGRREGEWFGRREGFEWRCDLCYQCGRLNSFFSFAKEEDDHVDVNNDYVDDDVGVEDDDVDNDIGVEIDLMEDDVGVDDDNT